MKKFFIEVDESALAIIGEGLVELPYRKSAAVIGDINRQIARQTESEGAGQNEDPSDGD